jgi:hypothetical protein
LAFATFSLFFWISPPINFDSGELAGSCLRNAPFGAWADTVAPVAHTDANSKTAHKQLLEKAKKGRDRSRLEMHFGSRSPQVHLVFDAGDGRP